MMGISEHQDVARAFRELANQVEALGRKAKLEAGLVALARKLRRVTLRDLEQDLRALRTPLAEIGVLLDAHAAASQKLRQLVESITAVIGEDN